MLKTWEHNFLDSAGDEQFMKPDYWCVRLVTTEDVLLYVAPLFEVTDFSQFSTAWLQELNQSHTNMSEFKWLSNVF